MKIILLAFCCINILLNAQIPVDSSASANSFIPVDSSATANLYNLKRFYNDPEVISLLIKLDDYSDDGNCEDFKRLQRLRFLHGFFYYNIPNTLYIASKYNCVLAYYILYLELQSLNDYLLKKNNNSNPYIIMLNPCNKEKFLRYMEKAEQYRNLAVYFYTGLYFKQDKQKAIEYMKKSYPRVISDEEALEKLESIYTEYFTENLDSLQLEE